MRIHATGRAVLRTCAAALLAFRAAATGATPPPSDLLPLLDVDRFAAAAETPPQGASDGSNDNATGDANRKNKESSRPPVKPAPMESQSPAEASQRAADRLDPSGALIIEPPAGSIAPKAP